MLNNFCKSEKFIYAIYGDNAWKSMHVHIYVNYIYEKEKILHMDATLFDGTRICGSLSTGNEFTGITEFRGIITSYESFKKVA